MKNIIRRFGSSNGSGVSLSLSSSSLSSSLHSTFSSGRFCNAVVLPWITQRRSIAATATATATASSQSVVSPLSTAATTTATTVATTNPDLHPLDLTILYNSHLDIELRENCRCEECCLTSTKQRKGTMKLNPNVAVTHMYEKDGMLYVAWNDGHKGFIPLADIDSVGGMMMAMTNDGNINGVSSTADEMTLNNPKKKQRKIPRYSEKVCPLNPPYLWDAQNVQSEIKNLSYSFNQILKDNTNLLHMIESLEKYGLVRVNDSFGAKGAAEILGKRMGMIRNTIYGDTFVVTSNREMITVASQAYTNGDLPPHTDLPYYELSPDVFVFHCIENGTFGGESYYVDGFKVAYDLKELYPKYFDILTTVKVPFRKNFMDKGFDMISNHHIIELNWDDMSIERIYFDEGNRQSLNWDLAMEKKIEFYEALRTYREMLFDEKNRYEFRMNRGEMTVFDNRRLLHARKAFGGKRVMEGCYLDWQSIHGNYRSQAAKINNQMKHK